MAAHSDNSIKIHASKCKGKLKLEVKDKPSLKASFRLWTCGSCSYVGRGEKLTEEQAKETRAKLKEQAEQVKAGKAKLEKLAKDKAAKPSGKGKK